MKGWCRESVHGRRRGREARLMWSGRLGMGKKQENVTRNEEKGERKGRKIQKGEGQACEQGGG